MSFCAVLLCGGESRRMGRDKSLVQWNGTPLWKLQLEKLRALAAEQIFVSAREDKSWRPADVPIVLDRLAARGPRSGISAALQECPSDHLLVLAIDLPLMSVAYLRALMQRAQRGVGIVPAIEQRFEPVAAIYPREIAAAFDDERESLQSLLRGLTDRGEMIAIEVQFSDRELFRNVNAPADLIAS